MLSALVIAAGGAIGYIAGKPSATAALRSITPGAQTIHRGALQTGISVPLLKP